ncbi:hypothetical protein [Allokutzneria sp. NRRL B-24872]|uniref:hypothetical protein n=1 Tax=Allokutzneria sp. NRRL B-24872 TaxID=1137961 RepID=UPI000A364A52|nr:hypothetical protein [Allokutzneria sp. NRRL B-24872]
MALPRIDEHAVPVAAPAEAVWAVLTEALDRSFSGSLAELYSRLVGCPEHAASGPRPLAEGSTLPGFRVAAATPPSELVLAGRHRFSNYELIFRIDSLGPDRSRLRAESLAVFPGALGRLYRALVIGTGGHAIAVRRMISGIAKAAISASPR